MRYINLGVPGKQGTQSSSLKILMTPDSRLLVIKASCYILCNTLYAYIKFGRETSSTICVKTVSMSRIASQLSVSTAVVLNDENAKL